MRPRITNHPAPGAYAPQRSEARVIARPGAGSVTWSTVVMGLYLVVLGLLSLNGVHRLWMVIEYLRRPRRPTPPDPAPWPLVTVQLPLFNERYVVERLVRAVAALDYPRDRLEIQVLDDSVDDTTTLASAVVDELAAAGHDIVLRHRSDRTGFKAGALALGLVAAKGDLVAVFDADFVPERDFLRKLVPHFADPGVGMVQARWGHLNADDDWLTRAQATLLDGHFVIEHTARNASGRWFNFNGTAGIWRRQAIVDGGGWQHDTLTEDLDLSYRSQLAGWRFVYLTDVVAPAELPPDMRAFKAQQHRWAKGSIQTCRKLLGRIWSSSAPLATRLEATAHLTANLSYPLVVLLTLLLPLAIVARVTESERLGAFLGLDLVLFGFALAPFLLFYGLAILGSGAPGVAGRLVRLPLVLSLGLGMAVSQSRAVWEGFAPSVGTFVRTPKTGGLRKVSYRAAGSSLFAIEALFGVYLTAAAVWVVWSGYEGSLPFLLLFAVGYGGVALGTLRSS